MKTIINNQGVSYEISDNKISKILDIIYSNGLYVMQKGEYYESEYFIIKKGMAKWDIFGGKLSPISNVIYN